MSAGAFKSSSARMPTAGGASSSSSLCWPVLLALFCQVVFHVSFASAASEGEDITEKATAEVHEGGGVEASDGLGGEDVFNEHHGDEGIEPFIAILFPAFSVTIGAIVFYVLSRYVHVLPFTGVMFLIGTIIGIGVELHTSADNQLNESVTQWVSINGELLLLVFLPGLIFRDAFGQNAHLFSLALTQCLIFAFPLVLAGTTLTALVCYYIFPFNWSFNLAMTVGSILSATDPVAVAALLEEVGAPPRLKVHIAGEALLNDGAAIVFFSIFSERYFYELEGLGLGEDVDFGRGVSIFCQKALGAVASGIFFGLGLLFFMYIFHKRFDREENVVEVTATVAIAYIGYYVSEVVFGFSGVISTVVTGVMTSFFGRPFINDPKLLDDFWILLEHLLNTVLFALGGVVWGAVIAKGEKNRNFGAAEWGYLILLYIFLNLIRLGLFSAAFPITSRIGLKTNWKETVFQVYGGLRGAVGIALAIALDNEVRENANEDDYEELYVDQTQMAFAFIGGIAFMTLTINGVTAGPLLRKLGLADSTESREKIINAYQARFKAHLIDEMVLLLAQPRFSSVNFAFVKYHVPYLRDMTRSQLMEAVEKHRDTTRAEDYHPPSLKRILPYLPVAADDAADVARTLASTKTEEEEKSEFDPELHARKMRRVLRTKNRMKRRSLSTMRVMMHGTGDILSLQELRLLFISILRSAYEAQIRGGELEDRQILAIALEASLDFAEDAVSNGGTLKDWEYVQAFDGSLTSIGQSLKSKLKVFKCVDKLWGKRARTKITDTTKRLLIERSLAFMSAHRWAQTFMQKEFADADCELSELGKQVFSESQEEYRKAQEILDQFDNKEVSLVVSHKFCTILLNSAIAYITKLSGYGLLKDQEAEHLTAEIEENINDTLLCEMSAHPGELDLREEEQSIRHMAKIEEAPDE